MPRVDFAQLPDDARVWIFAASDALGQDAAGVLLGHVDEYLEQWQAHGEPLVNARDWRDERFLAIGVDQRSAGASGCSIDGMFRVLQRLQESLGTSLVGGGRVFYRDRNGGIHSVARSDFGSLAADGAVDDATPVFDTAVTSAGAYRRDFERSVRDSWHRQLIPVRR